MSKPFNPTPHPVLCLPSMEEAMALGEEGFRNAMLRRERIIAEEKQDPFGKGWEPSIWKVCDALMGYPWVDKEWAERLRRHLGFEKRVQVLLVNGGNRAGKSERASKRVMRILRLGDERRAWALHTKAAMSRDYQQPLFWKYMDAALKKKEIRSQTTYVAYKMKTGFSEEKFVLPNKSDCSFLNYEMEKETIEGGNLDIIWPDELVPPDWVETMELRIAEKKGWMEITFTPVQGYSETVRLFQDGANVVKWSTAFLCPKDGGPPDVARTLGLTEAELAENLAAEAQERASRCPQSRPQNCEAWLEGKTGQPEIPDGREFERVPRVMKCISSTPGSKVMRAVVFFYSSDNPFGNPYGVWSFLEGKSQDFIKERFYGLATKTTSARFPKFDLDAHVIKPEAVPAQGTNYHLTDPASGRNFYMLWVRVTPEGIFVYREWPGNFYIPGVGVPGPWALPDGKKPDGRMGPAQATFGFGNLRYKAEIARLEGWKDFLKHETEIGDGFELAALKAAGVADWDDANGARERIEKREMDSRFASTPKQENDRPKTLLTDFEEINCWFETAPAAGHDQVNEGIQLINDALDFDASQEVDFYNKPRLWISSDCQNLIYALRTWTGQDGQKGATRDPIETLRWVFQAEHPYVGNEEKPAPMPGEEGLKKFVEAVYRRHLGSDWGEDED